MQQIRPAKHRENPVVEHKGSAVHRRRRCPFWPAESYKSRTVHVEAAARRLYGTFARVCRL